MIAAELSSEATEPNPTPPPAAPGPTRAMRTLWSVPPEVILPRLTGHLETLIARHVAYHERGNLIALHLHPDEAAEGGTATITMPVDLRCPACRDRPPAGCPSCSGRGSHQERFTAWLTIPRQVTHGAILAGSVELPDALAVVRFRVLIDPTSA